MEQEGAAQVKMSSTCSSPAGAFTHISAAIPVAAPGNAKFEDLEEGH